MELSTSEGERNEDGDAEKEWRYIGEAETLKLQRCRHVYSQKNKYGDCTLIYLADSNTFTAMETWCSHMGGPLHEGDIEDYKGRPHLMCPWHGYLFDAVSGKNEIGLQQEMYQTKVEEGKVFVLHKRQLSLQPFKQQH